MFGEDGVGGAQLILAEPCAGAEVAQPFAVIVFPTRAGLGSLAPPSVSAEASLEPGVAAVVSAAVVSVAEVSAALVSLAEVSAETSPVLVSS